MIFTTGLVLMIVLVIVWRLFRMDRLPQTHWAVVSMGCFSLMACVLMALSIIMLLARVMP